MRGVPLRGLLSHSREPLPNQQKRIGEEQNVLRLIIKIQLSFYLAAGCEFTIGGAAVRRRHFVKRAGNVEPSLVGGRFRACMFLVNLCCPRRVPTASFNQIGSVSSNLHVASLIKTLNVKVVK